MGRERSYDDRILRKRDIERYRDLPKTPEQEVEFKEWLENLPRKVVAKYEQEVEESERKKKEEVRKLFEELYRNRVLTFQQYDALYNLRFCGKSRKQIMEETGKSDVALRGIIHDAKQAIISKGLWDKYYTLFDKTPNGVS